MNNLTLASVAIFCLFAAACQNSQTGNSVNSRQDIPIPQTSASPAATATPPDLSGVPMTLPMIDAILADDTASAELKSHTQITDEQIQKIRDAARDAVLRLTESGGQDSERSTSAATKKAIAKVKEIVGSEKADTVVAYLREKWTGTGADTMVSAPNSVPTDTRIVVNAPAYRMDIFRDGKITKSYKIGIGYPEFPLPAGLRKANEIIFNPTWTPPDEPWVKGKFAPGKKVEAGSKDNPLGPIKIPIGLPSLIHGGKAPAKLGTFASHGCVGLTNGQVQDFTVELSSLAGQPLSMGDIKAYEKDTSETKKVKFDAPVPVELRYETIVVTSDGKLTIYRDVYERGTNTEDNLRRVLDAAGVSFDSLPAADQAKIRVGLEQMAIDASGDPVERGPETDKNKKSTSAKVTRTIKGKRQLVFDLAQLKGKGYPAPVNLKTA
ncbi:MAG TPA: L,D-transpeptidase family protein [Pyrinomonadaceae bacterium]|nr:L,D-transpeptidase family protein [Pyrinomonadaceae bacterium]